MARETEFNNTESTANQITSSFEIIGSLATPSDVDFYKINLVAGSITINFNAPERRSPPYFKIDTGLIQNGVLQTLNTRTTGKDISSAEVNLEVQTISISGTYYFSIAAFENYTNLPYGLTITQNPATNQLPIANNDTATAAVGESTIINIGANDSDPDNDELSSGSFQSTTNGNQGTVVYNNNVGAPDTATYTPNPGSSGRDSFEYQISDGRGGLDKAEVIITIVPGGSNPNFAPTAENDTATIAGGRATIINIGANDSDPNNDEIITIGATNPSKGTVRYTDNRGTPDTVTYTPNANASGTDIFTYQVSDGKGASDTATVTVTLKGQSITESENNNSVLNADSVNVGTEVRGNLTTSADIDFYKVDLLPGIININFDAPGNFSPSFFKIDTNYLQDGVLQTLHSVNTGKDISDANLNTPSQTLTKTGSYYFSVSPFENFSNLGYGLTVTQATVQNQSPSAQNDSADASTGLPILINIGSNDSDPNNDELLTTGVTNPIKGTVQYTENTGSPDTVLYTPASGAIGTDSFIYQVADGLGGTDTATVSVLLKNGAPTAQDDTAAANAVSPVIIEIGANDSDPENDELTTTGLINPSKGSVEYTENIGTPDTVVYTVTPGQTGRDNFTYRVTDAKGNVDTATVTVTIENSSPVANDDSIHLTAQSSAVTINIGDNDSDPDNDPLTTTALTRPTKGTVQYTENLGAADTITYTPNQNARGIDSFTYQVSDGNGKTDTATVTVSFQNDPPVALDDTANASSGTPVTIEIGANDSDPNKDELITTGLTAPSKGTVQYIENTGSPDTVLYTPNSINLTGSDSFTYTITDTKGLSDTATVTISFENSAPIAENDTASVGSTQPIVINIGANDSDPNGDELTTTGLTAPQKGSVRYTDNIGSPDTVLYTPNPNATGSDTFSYQISDGKGKTDTASVTVTFNNTPPIARDDEGVVPDANPVTIVIGENDSDPDGDELSTTGLTSPTQGIISYDDKSGQPDIVIYTPNPNASGPDSFTYQVEDGKGGFDNATVNIINTNNPPEVLDETAEAFVGSETTIQIGANDSDANGDRLTYSAETSPTQGTVKYLGSVAIYAPFNSANGTDSFTYKSEDGRGGFGIGRVTITFQNSPPTANDDFVNVRSGQSTIIYIGANDSDPNTNDELTTTPGRLPDKGIAEYQQNIGSPDTVLYTPRPGASGIDTFSYNVSDGNGETDTAEVRITILGNPVAENDSAEAIPGQAINIDIGNNDTHPNGDELKSSILKNPSQGTVTITDNVGSPDTATYLPNINAQNSDTFTYQISDGKGGSDTATVSITFDNRPPIAGDDTGEVFLGESTVIIIGANDSDPENDPLTTTGIIDPRKGSVVYTENTDSPDTVTYTPFSTARGTDSFTYQIADGKGGTNTATVTVEIKTTQNAVWNSATYTGYLSVGQKITSDESFSDPDGDTDGIVFNQFSIIDALGNRTIVGQVATPLPEHADHKWSINEISYSFDVTANSSFDVFGWQAFSEIEKNITRRAMNEWELDSNFNFKETTTSNPDLIIGYDTITEERFNQTSILGYVRDINFDQSLSTDPNLIEPHFGEKQILGMNITTSDRGQFSSLFNSTVLHELGHVVGLDHITTEPSIMAIAADSPNNRNTIQPIDIAVAQNLYPTEEIDTPLSRESVILTADMVGKTLLVQKGFYDDSGVFEVSPEYVLGIINGNPDIPGDFSTTAQLGVNGSVISDHTNVDGSIDLRDMFKVDLKKGGTYIFEIKGAASSNGSLLIPYGELYNPNGISVAGDFGSGRTSANSIARDAAFFYTVPDEPAGPYFFASVGGANSFETGTYSISV
ncbi:Ig-like domain-containing protein, partial [Rhodospirillaceae bacterium]|nr:Ig-like domain-containing protein [Rhodospirillaceae bacterium]